MRAYPDPPSAVVAIPAKDEADRIAGCLAALAMQRDRHGVPLPTDAFSILVLANNCRDATAAVARDFAARMPVPLHVVECALGPAQANAGGARGAAMDRAADQLEAAAGSGGVILTTDADSRVGPGWVDANLRAIAAGVDAVAGTIDADPGEYLALGRGFLDRGRAEDRFLARVAELFARLDPRPHDPWPNHRVHSGASFAVTLAAYRAIGGLPARPLGEDAALAQALEERGLLIRHALDAVVVTSCRFDGRARGGAGDTMKLRHADLDAPCDDDLEPAIALFRRARLRGQMRRLHAAGRLGDGSGWRLKLGLDAATAAGIAAHGAAPPFAALWSAIETASPRLARGEPLRPSHLAIETARIERLLAMLARSPRAAADGLIRLPAGSADSPEASPVGPLRGERRDDRGDTAPRGVLPRAAATATPTR